MGSRSRYGLTSTNRLYTIDDVQIEGIVSNLLIPAFNRYNDLEGLDWRGLLCENDDETLREFPILDQLRLPEMGPHEIPFFRGRTSGTYQEFVKKYGKAFGIDTTFLMYAKPHEYLDKVKEAIEMDKRTIRWEILREVLNPQTLGRGFWNQTFDVNSTLTIPPAWGTNTFLASHTHYKCQTAYPGTRGYGRPVYLSHEFQ